MANTPFTPTAEQMEATHYGITVCHIGEDGDMLALGHHDPRRALAAFNRHARTVLGLANYLDDRSAVAAEALETITHVSMAFRTPDPAQGEDPDWFWVAEEVAPGAPDSTPCTYARLA